MSTIHGTGGAEGFDPSKLEDVWSDIDDLPKTWVDGRVNQAGARALQPQAQVGGESRLGSVSDAGRFTERPTSRGTRRTSLLGQQTLPARNSRGSRFPSTPPPEAPKSEVATHADKTNRMSGELRTIKAEIKYRESVISSAKAEIQECEAQIRSGVKVKKNKKAIEKLKATIWKCEVEIKELGQKQLEKEVEINQYVENMINSWL